MIDNEPELKYTIFKLLGTKRSAQRWREYGQFGLILLAIGAIIAGVAIMQYYASKLP